MKGNRASSRTNVRVEQWLVSSFSPGTVRSPLDREDDYPRCFPSYCSELFEWSVPKECTLRFEIPAGFEFVAKFEPNTQ